MELTERIERSLLKYQFSILPLNYVSVWSPQLDSNQQPARYKCAALSDCAIRAWCRNNISLY